jgi:hypothetical protein
VNTAEPRRWETSDRALRRRPKSQGRGPTKTSRPVLFTFRCLLPIFLPRQGGTRICHCHAPSYQETERGLRPVLPCPPHTSCWRLQTGGLPLILSTHKVLRSWRCPRMDGEAKRGCARGSKSLVLHPCQCCVLYVHVSRVRWYLLIPEYLIRHISASRQSMSIPIHSSRTRARRNKATA